MNDTASFAERISSSSECGEETNVEVRLVRRHGVIFFKRGCFPPLNHTLQILQHSSTRQVGETIVHSFLDKIDALYFARDYNLLDSTEKTTWIKLCFFEYAGFDLSQPFDTNNQLVKDSYKSDWRRWRREFGDDTTARNRLYSIFTYVSASSVDRCRPR